MIPLPETESSLWRQIYPKATYPRLHGELAVDVAIVGGGITGLTAAYLLKEAGLKVAVIEMRTIGSGTTGRTTGKVSAQHNLIYYEMDRQLGRRTAKLYAQANLAAVAEVKRIAEAGKLDSVWQDEVNYVYTADSEQAELFKLEAQTAMKLGLPATFETSSPLPFNIAAAVKLTDQGYIHSQRYLLGLARAVNSKGSIIFENSYVIGIRDGVPARVRTPLGTVLARDIIVATNVPTLPLMARGGYCLLEYPTESYIVAGRRSRKFGGMYISPDKDHYSILPVEIEGVQWLLVGGESNISGMRLDKGAKYRRLAEYAQLHFNVEEISYKWSDRDYQTYDGPPLAGKLYPWSKHVYVASAFRKWGLSNGTAAALMLRDQLTGQSNPWASAYDPNRTRAVKFIPKVFAKHVSGRR